MLTPEIMGKLWDYLNVESVAKLAKLLTAGSSRAKQTLRRHDQPPLVDCTHYSHIPNVVNNNAKATVKNARRSTCL